MDKFISSKVLNMTVAVRDVLIVLILSTIVQWHIGGKELAKVNFTDPADWTVLKVYEKVYTSKSIWTVSSFYEAGQKSEH